MKWSKSINKENGYVIVNAEGSKNVNDTVKFVKESTEAAQRHRFNKYLFDLSKAEDKYSVLDIYENLNMVSEYGFKKNDRVALVGNDTFTEFKFAEDVSYNNGWIKFKYFNTIQDAKNWLEGC